jgi:hypothetical protein
MHRFDILSQDGCRTSGRCPAKPLPHYVSRLNQVVAGASFFKSLTRKVASPQDPIPEAPRFCGSSREGTTTAAAQRGVPPESPKLN